MKRNLAVGRICPVAEGVIISDITGRFGWRARYLKEADAGETTVRFWQEIYDDTGRLVEIHEKFPMDKGHQKA